MTKIEEVARAIYYAENTSERPEWEREPPSVQKHLRYIARAAIEAMREPTVPMLDAGHEGLVRGPRYEVIDCYQAMIDAILSEGE